MRIHSDLHSCLVLTLLGGVELLELHFDYFTGILSLVDNQYNMVLFIKKQMWKGKLCHVQFIIHDAT